MVLAVTGLVAWMPVVYAFRLTFLFAMVLLIIPTLSLLAGYLSREVLVRARRPPPFRWLAIVDDDPRTAQNSTATELTPALPPYRLQPRTAERFGSPRSTATLYRSADRTERVVRPSASLGNGSERGDDEHDSAEQPIERRHQPFLSQPDDDHATEHDVCVALARVAPPQIGSASADAAGFHSRPAAVTMGL